MTSRARYIRVAAMAVMPAAVLMLAAASLPAAEPSMAQYTHYPIFQVGAVDPRIMIILDNSGSMNFPAYGYGYETWPNGAVLPQPFDGRDCDGWDGRIMARFDDAFEQQRDGLIALCDGNDARNSFEIILGHDYTNRGDSRCNRPQNCACQEPVIAALRFDEVMVPREVGGEPVTVSNAYIEFTGRENPGGPQYRRAALNLTIRAEAVDSAAAITAAAHNISSRETTDASVAWNIPGGRDYEWADGHVYISPNIGPIIQEIISRPGWEEGNAILITIDPGPDPDGARLAQGFRQSPETAPRLIIEHDPCNVSLYYGYFDPQARYKYEGNMFVRDPGGPWDGNFLNFLSMRRGDVLRKVLVGGLTTSRPGGGGKPSQIGIEGNTSPGGDFWRQHVGAGMSPWADARYKISNGNIHVYDSAGDTSLGTFKIEVLKDRELEPRDFYFDPDEGDDIQKWKLGGVLQKVGDRAQWGTAWFNGRLPALTSGKAEISAPMGSNMVSMQNDISGKPFNTWTPLAEALYVVTQYFKQQDAEVTGYSNSAIGPFNNQRDPFYDRDGEFEETCAQAFCILLTDGVSSMDERIPEYLKNFAGEGVGSFDNAGTTYARDVAAYMRTTDLRPELVDFNNVILYVVYALGNDSDARDLLMDTAKYGGFVDLNGNNWPDLQAEWDSSGNGIPDNYFEAQDGYKLEQALMDAIMAILERAGSGTAVSVLATKGEGEGTLVQAFFNPRVDTEDGVIRWTGYLHSLWVDTHGQIREDTVNDYSLNLEQDERILFDVDETSGDTVVKRIKADEDEPYESVVITQLRSIWSAGDRLAATDPFLRNIFTYRGSGTEADPHENFIRARGFWDIISFSNFLGINDDTAWRYLGDNPWARAYNLMLWTMGVPDNDSEYHGTVDLRKRTLDDGRLWKLGDIIHSTPTTMAQPLADYDLLYNDLSYYEYYMRNRNRETVVLVGSNSGKLHAFTGWVYHDNEFVNPYDVTGYFNGRPDMTAGNVPIGSELWAYIPQSLLPHLKWLPHPEYTHVNFIDLRPRVFDARIFEPSELHPNGWGTVVVGGLGFAAGMEIPVNPNHADPDMRITMHPSFFALDVTNPRDPRLLWERSFPDMGMSSNYPNIVKVGDNWLLAIGSGPTSMDAVSSHPASLIIVDLKTGGNVDHGGLKRIFTLPGGEAFANEPIALDKNMNYNVDAVYVTANYNNDTAQLFRLTIPQKEDVFKPWDEAGFPPEYVDDPADEKWTITKLFKSPQPITASATLSVDRQDNAWVFFGTGRFLAVDDKYTSDQNYLVGIKDPFFNPDLEDCNYSYPAAECEINRLNNFDELFDADEYTVYGFYQVEAPGNETVTFGDMVSEARRNVFQGWFRRLVHEAGTPSERVVNKGAVLGGIYLQPTYTPNSDPCGYGGSSRIFGVYYETGTAYYRQIFQEGSANDPIIDVIDLGDGLASSLSIHSGRQTGGKVYIQKSTGEIIEIDVTPAFNIKHGPEYWLDDGYY